MQLPFSFWNEYGMKARGKVRTRPSLTAALCLASLAGCEGGPIPFFDKSHGAIEICEKRLINSLSSPASYNRVDVSYVPGPPLTFEDYRESEDAKLCKSHTAEDCAGNLEDFYRAYMVKLQLLGLLGKKDADGRQLQSDAPMPNVSAAKYRKAEEKVLEMTFRALKESRVEHPETAFVTITYDAANLYNATLRSQYVCSFLPRARSTFTDHDLGISG